MPDWMVTVKFRVKGTDPETGEPHTAESAEDLVRSNVSITLYGIKHGGAHEEGSVVVNSVPSHEEEMLAFVRAARLGEPSDAAP